MTHREIRKDRFEPEYGVLAPLEFELDIKTINGKNESSSLTKYFYTPYDFDWVSDPYLPHLDITDHVEVLGDYFGSSD